MQSESSVVVVLGTGGTIAGSAPSPLDDLKYIAATQPVESLVAGLVVPDGVRLETEQVAQLDSKDMDFVTWLALAERVAHHVRRAEVAGVVVTHGTDTLEETAYFLQRVLAPAKPVVLTGAMRPATSLQADGPRNLADAIGVAQHVGGHGVVVAFAGHVHAARSVRKSHSHAFDAFSSGDAGALARVDGGVVLPLREWPVDAGLGLAVLPADTARWPVVEIVASHVGARGRVVDALCAAGADGLVVAATGNGTVHAALVAALHAARARGVAVLHSTRCADGGIVDRESDNGFASAGELSPVKARVELMLRLMPGQPADRTGRTFVEDGLDARQTTSGPK